MSVSRRAWVAESLRAVAVSATGFIALLGLRAARPVRVRDRVVRVPADDHDKLTVIDDALVVRRGGQVRAFSLRCPHLGCKLSLDADERGLTCPCHGSRFDLDGNRISGPATRGLTELRVALTDSSAPSGR